MKTKEKAPEELLEELRSEVNLLRYPFFALTTKDVKNRLKTTYSREVARDEKKIEIEWKVTSNPEYGYPGPFDKRVHQVIEQIIERKDFPVSNPFQFSIYKICKGLGISTGGSNYEKIKEALERLITTSIQSKGTFYHKGKKKWIDRTFHLYDSLIYKGEEMEDGTVADTNYLYLNDLYLESINARYVKPLDFRYYKSLNTNVAKRLYELLGVKFFGLSRNNHSYIRYKYTTLCELLPLRKQRYPSDVKRQFQSAHQQLTETDFLEKVSWEEINNGERDWYIYYFPGSKAEEEIDKYNKSSNASLRKLPELARAALTPAEEASVGTWKDELTRKLNDDENKNEQFYHKLAKLIVRKEISEGIVRKCLSETVSEDQMRGKDPDSEQIRNRSAYFTSLLKDQLQKTGKDLKTLLQSVS